MPRYFFDVAEPQSECVDDEGAVLPDAKAAHEMALKGIRSILCADVLRGRLSLRGALSIRDEAGAVIARVPFAEAVSIEERSAAAA